MFYESTIRTCSYPSVTFIYESIGTDDFLIEWCLRISDLGFYAVRIILLLMAKNGRS
jgi:hypothetical protein